MNQFCYTKGFEISEPVGCKALRQDHLIVLAMLLGCDYTLGVHGVGIVNGPLGLTLGHPFSQLIRVDLPERLEIVRAYSPGRGHGTVQDAVG